MATGLKIVNGDIIINKSGKVDFVKNIDKVKRDLSKILWTSTEKAAGTTLYYRYNPNYGTAIHNLNLLRGLSKVAKLQTLNLMLQETLNYFVKIQENRTNLDMEEIVLYIDFNAYYDSERRDTINFDITVTTAFEEVTIGTITRRVQ